MLKDMNSETLFIAGHAAFLRSQFTGCAIPMLPCCFLRGCLLQVLPAGWDMPA